MSFIKSVLTIFNRLFHNQQNQKHAEPPLIGGENTSTEKEREHRTTEISTTIDNEININHNDIPAETLHALNALWIKNGRASEILVSGTVLWHCGTVELPEHIAESTMMWFTRKESKKNKYAGFAKLGASSINNVKETFRLRVQTTRELTMADFNLQSLQDFTETYCGGNHNQMKATVGAWCNKNNFDGCVKMNKDEDEVALAHPKNMICIIEATRL